MSTYQHTSSTTTQASIFSRRSTGRHISAQSYRCSVTQPVSLYCKWCCSDRTGSTGTVHTSTKARLTSVMIGIHELPPKFNHLFIVKCLLVQHFIMSNSPLRRSGMARISFYLPPTCLSLPSSAKNVHQRNCLVNNIAGILSTFIYTWCSVQKTVFQFQQLL